MLPHQALLFPARRASVTGTNLSICFGNTAPIPGSCFENLSGGHFNCLQAPPNKFSQMSKGHVFRNEKLFVRTDLNQMTNKGRKLEVWQEETLPF